MAGSTIIRRRSYDQLRATDFNESHAGYVCDCKQEFMTTDDLRRHQQNSCKNRTVKCPFCQEMFPSSTNLRDHLTLCGNKTDKCPNCHQLIRRSHFAYHYENNCASVDQIETPPSRPKSRQSQSIPTNSNRPILRVDIPADGPRQDYSNHSSPRVRSRSPLSISTSINAQNIIQCEYCHNACIRNDYQAHKEKCLRNPANANMKQQVSSNGVVHIPCEFCNELIDLPRWSLHTQACRERENQRIANRADAINKQPITDLFPCDYCGQNCSPQQLPMHEETCRENPVNQRAAARTHPRQRPSPSVALPVKQSYNQGQSISPDARSHNNNTKFAHYQRIDVDRTHRANQSQDDGTVVNPRNTHSNSPRSIRSNDESARRNNARSHENLPPTSREDTFKDRVPVRSNSFDSLNKSPKGRHTSNDSADHRRAVSANGGKRKSHKKSDKGEINVGSRDRSKPPKKPSALMRFFGCTTTAVYD